MSASSLGLYLHQQLSSVISLSLKAVVSPYSHVVVIVLGLVFLGVGAQQLVLASEVTPQACPACNRSEAFHCLKSPVERLSASDSAKLVVDVAGAVKKPGIYQLSQGSRLADAIARAGGLSPEADTTAISKSYNLATLLTANSKIYLPKIGDEDNYQLSPTSSSHETTASALINVNTASQSQLEELPSVGAVTAAKIIANRPYETVDELVAKDVVTETSFSKFKSLITTE